MRYALLVDYLNLVHVLGVAVGFIAFVENLRVPGCVNYPTEFRGADLAAAGARD
jgi:hypothetical protein